MESKPLLESRCHGEVEFAEPSTEPKAAALAGGRAHTTGLLRATRAFAAGAALLGAIGAPAIGGVVLVSRADGGTDGAHDADDGGQEGAVAHMEMVREAPASAVRGAVDGLSTMLSAQELVDEMTMSEKISLLHGQRCATLCCSCSEHTPPKTHTHTHTLTHSLRIDAALTNFPLASRFQPSNTTSTVTTPPRCAQLRPRPSRLTLLPNHTRSKVACRTMAGRAPSVGWVSLR